MLLSDEVPVAAVPKQVSTAEETNCAGDSIAGRAAAAPAETALFTFPFRGPVGLATAGTHGAVGVPGTGTDDGLTNEGADADEGGGAMISGGLRYVSIRARITRCGM